MTVLSLDEKNIYVSSKVPTNYWLKVFLLSLNILFLFATLFIVYETKYFLTILLPILYSFTLGKYFLWNIYGEEFYIISTSHISYRHNYGIFKTNLKSFEFDALENCEDITNPNTKGTNLSFVKYSAVNNLPEIVFQTTIKIELDIFLDIVSKLGEMKYQQVSFIPFSNN